MVHREMLPNGLVVLVRELPGARAVALNLWLRTGSAHDPPRMVGISHFLEHLLFRGRTERGEVDLALEVQAAGGHLNAETGVDHTAFHQVVPADAWRETLALQACVVASPLFDEERVEVERRVIAGECALAERDTWGFLWRRLMETTFAGEPWGRPVMGTSRTLSRISRRDLVAHHRAVCRAQNLVQVIVGDVDPSEAVALCRACYRALQAGGPPRRPRGERWPGRAHAGGASLDLARAPARVFRGSTPHACVGVSFRTVPALHADAPALDVLAAVLGGGRASRLSRRLKDEDGLVSEISAGHVSMAETGVFAVRAAVPRGGVDDAARAVLRELDEARAGGADDGEVARAVLALEARHALEHETAESLAWTLGTYEVYGDHRLADDYVRRASSVTAKDVRAAAGAYLARERATVVACVPEDAPG